MALLPLHVALLCMPTFSFIVALAYIEQAIYTTGLCTLMVYFAHFGK